MNIQPRPDQELTIQEAIRMGLIKSEIDALDLGIGSLRAKFTEKFEMLPIKYSSRTPQDAAAHIRDSRKGNFLPKGLAIKELINEGRA